MGGEGETLGMAEGGERGVGEGVVFLSVVVALSMADEVEDCLGHFLWCVVLLARIFYSWFLGGRCWWLWWVGLDWTILRLVLHAPLNIAHMI